MTSETSTTRRAPRDHKKKAALAAPGSVAATVRGVEWTIEAAALDDWDLIEDLNDPTGASLPSATRRLLGAVQYETAREMVRDAVTGRVPATAMSELIGEIFTAVKAGNS